MFVYVLELEDKRYYVGIAEDIGLRLWTHFRGKGTGSAWTKKYNPLKVIHCSQVVPNTRKKAEIIENECTLRIAKLVGFSKVRGAAFSASSESYPKSWDEKLIGIPEAKFEKMKPLSETDLNILMRGKYKVYIEGKKKGRNPKT